MSDKARETPRVGDVWRTSEGHARSVAMFKSGPGGRPDMHTVFWRDHLGWLDWCWASQWNLWAESATLITRGTGEEAPWAR